MRLKNILKDCVFSGTYNENTEISGISYNSKTYKPGEMFVAIKGAVCDGHCYAGDAYNNGCKVFIAEHSLDLPGDAVVLIVPDSRKALSKISANFFSHPSKNTKVIGVTGTNGKTTVTYMMKKAFSAAGKKAGVIGTNGAFFDGKTILVDNTTPESYEMQKILREMADSGCEYVFCEISSLGMKQHRADDVDFFAAVFTNFSEDHVGGAKHESTDEYLLWKKKLFSLCENAVINADDERFGEFFEACTCPVKTYGIHNSADFYAENIVNRKNKNGFGVSFDLIEENTVQEVFVGLPGVFSVYNALASAVVCEICGINFFSVADSFSDIHVDGRSERISLFNGAEVIIDYAHNKEGVRNILKTLSGYEHNRIITVFGCVGERAQIRRRGLAEAVAEFSDIAVITSDDPANENPLAIASEEAEYMKELGGKFVVFTDRAEAVRWALGFAGENDFVVLLGKGHEKFQKIGGKKVPFSDRAEIEKFLMRTVS